MRLPFTRQSSETSVRSLVKTVSWRIVAAMDTFVIAYIITGKALSSVSIVSIEFVTKIIWYYLHERGWDHINWGRRVSTFTWKWPFVKHE